MSFLLINIYVKKYQSFLNNITQLELSKLTGLKQPAIARIEKTSKQRYFDYTNYNH